MCAIRYIHCLGLIASTICVDTHMYEFNLILVYIHLCAYTGGNGQFIPRVLDLQVVGVNNTGYLEVTVMYRNGTIATGPVCGTVNRVTGDYACRSIGFSVSSMQGTVDSIM